MITDLILNAFLACIDALVSLLPTINLPPLIPFDLIAQFSYSMNRVTPLGTVLQLMFVAIGIRLALQGWEFIQWIYHQFWGAS